MEDPDARHDDTRRDRTFVRLLGVSGGCALIALAVLGIHESSTTSDSPHVLAGSGDAPTNTVYVQPVVGAAKMGETATWTTPAPTPEVEKAVPPVKAGG